MVVVLALKSIFPSMAGELEVPLELLDIIFQSLEKKSKSAALPAIPVYLRSMEELKRRMERSKELIVSEIETDTSGFFSLHMNLKEKGLIKSDDADTRKLSTLLGEKEEVIVRGILEIRDSQIRRVDALIFRLKELEAFFQSQPD